MNEQKKPRVLFVNGYIYVPGEGGYKRTLYLFNMMKSMGYECTLLTSDFNHYAKKKRNVEEFYKIYPDFKDIVMLPMNAYEKNISIKRWWAGYSWSKRVKAWFEQNWQKYNVVYMHMPDANSILNIKPICDAHNIKMAVDVRDLRPEGLRVVFKKEWLYNMLTCPMKKKANKAYACADQMIAVSNEYLQRGMSVNNKSKDPVAVFIGAIFDKFYSGIEKNASKIEKRDGDIWVTYAGTLGSTYDLYTMLDAAKVLQDEGKEEIIFKILGQGPEAESLKQYAADKGLKNVDFVGFVDYEMMAAYLSKSDMTVNSVKRRASQSIINKVADYFAAGIPCLNGSICKEMQDLITDWNAGINYEPEDVNSFVKAIKTIIDNPELAAEFGANAKRLAAEKFDRSISYKEIIKRLDNLVK